MCKRFRDSKVGNPYFHSFFANFVLSLQFYEGPLGSHYLLPRCDHYLTISYKFQNKKSNFDVI